MWSERHRPASVAGMVGNEEARAAAASWLAKWKKGVKPLLMTGPPGTGKTTTASLLAARYGYDVIGLNASDARSKSRIRGILGPVLERGSVTGRPQLVFVDEADGIHGRSDYGGAAELAAILKEPAVPMILAANDDSHDRMKPIKKACKQVRFMRVPPRLMRVFLEGVLEREGAHLGPGAMIRVVEESRGDMRAMLNLAQQLAGGTGLQTGAPPGGLDVGSGVDAFFAAGDADGARAALWSISADPLEKIRAFFSSVVMSGMPAADLADCLDAISRADVLLGRIRKGQNWRLLRYLDSELERTRGRKVRYARYDLPWQLLGRIRWEAAKHRKFAGREAPRLHVSRSFFATSCLPCMIRCTRDGTLEPPEGIEELMG
ncbi:MAG: AAA family ATPase [Nitrosopumilus sp.]|nr:AAA family ATPase [Nitrosopumilus sp.]